MDKPNKYLYHVTSACNKSSILQQGLTRSNIHKRNSFGIYLCENPSNWRGLSSDPIVVTVDTEGLREQFTTIDSGLDEFLYWGDIPLQNIIEITALSVNQFDEGC